MKLVDVEEEEEEVEEGEVVEERWWRKKGEYEGEVEVVEVVVEEEVEEEEPNICDACNIADAGFGVHIFITVVLNMLVHLISVNMAFTPLTYITCIVISHAM